MEKVIKGLLVLMFVALIPATSSAADLKLKGIMQELDRKMQSVVNAISREDFDVIEEDALLISDHEKPPVEERKKIIKFLGERAGIFKGADRVVHNKAKAMSQAATAKDMESVIQLFMEVQRGCISCHSQFKKSIIKQFYK